MAFAFGGVIFAMAVLALVSAGSLFGVRSAVGNVTAMSDADQALIGIQSRAVAAEGLLKDYVIRPDGASAERVEETLDDAVSMLDDAEDGAAALGKTATLNNMRKTLESTRKSASRIIEAQTNIQKHVDTELMVRGSKIADSLKVIKDTAHDAAEHDAAYRASVAEANYLSMRVNVTRYLSDSSGDTAKKAKADLLNLEDSMNLVYEVIGTGAQSTRADGVIADVVAYDKAFDAVITSTKIRDNEINKVIKVSGPRLAKDAQKIVASIGSVRSRATLIAQTSAGAALLVVVIAAAAGITLAFLAGFVIYRIVAQPITLLAKQMRSLADGKFDTEVHGIERGDEVGDMARAVEVFRANAKEVEERRRVALESEKREFEQQQKYALVQEEERQRSEAERRQAMLGLADRFEQTVGQLVDQVDNSARQIRDGARMVSNDVDTSVGLMADVVAAASQSSVNSTEVASAADEMSVSINEVSSQIASAAYVAQEASVRAKVTDSVVAELVHTTQMTQSMVDLIANVAKQTNLLALNATIEASRAGEAGRGFAVVASEIKELANQTSAATNDIQRNIGHAVATSSKAIEAITEIGLAIDEISGVAMNISVAMEQQALTTAQIAQNTGQVANSSQLVTINLSEVKNGIESSGKTARDALVAVEYLDQQSARMKQTAAEFLKEVRAA
ncbi:MAG: methyl-accepting chemotaxis protein [Sphingorhabdus sp.]